MWVDVSMKKREKQELAIVRAKEYANSGEYRDWIQMEIALRSEFPKLRFSRFEQQEYDKMCRQAQARQPNSNV